MQPLQARCGTDYQRGSSKEGRGGGGVSYKSISHVGVQFKCKGSAYLVPYIIQGTDKQAWVHPYLLAWIERKPQRGGG